ncbi:MAG: hypothetical protein CSA18_02340 [Deltaproteobacteria bacterium]|nr:MAG: hypothetical protein CSB21_01125 [Deltaproteobacteria bacterium]PIE74970.1 MAG: hypothetical protein CSA18_02340 [Deltaproteobacteria bacterium]
MFNFKKPLFILFFTIFACQIAFASSVNRFKALPPFTAASVKSNVLLVMDYSGSMKWPAHRQNYSSEVYDPSEEYFGYFEYDKYYKYNETEQYWEVETNPPSPFTPLSGELSSDSIFPGNFLNFITTSRFDSALKTLTGGSAECPNGKNYCIINAKRISYGSYKIETNYAKYTFKVGSNNTNVHISLNKGWNKPYTTIFKSRKVRVKTNKDKVNGIIQENFDKLRFGFMVYSKDRNGSNQHGLIKYGFNENNMDDLISEIVNTKPYGNTYTGEALETAYNYLRHDGLTGSNSSYLHKKTIKDPFYEKTGDGSISPAPCRKNFIVLISDGKWNGKKDPDEWAKKLHTEDLRTDKDGAGADIFPGKQAVNIFSLFVFANDIKGEQGMKTVAAFGNFKDKSGCSNNNPYGFNLGYDSKYNQFPRKNCNPLGTYNSCCSEWDADGDGNPDAFFKADNGQAMVEALSKIFEQIKQGTASGTSIGLTTKTSAQRTILNQAAFYPERKFKDKKSVFWTGDLVGEWFAISKLKDESGNEKFIQNIREDTNNNYILDITEDRILDYFVEEGSLVIKAYDSNIFGTIDDPTTPDETYSTLSEVPNLIDYGKELEKTHFSKRKIYSVDKDNNLNEFKVDNSDLFKPLLGTDPSEYHSRLIISSGSPDYKKLINYVKGEDFSGTRSRATSNLPTPNIWKLGDIAYSSPAVVNYDDYSIIYVGSNDGMLHAFRTGFVKKNGKKFHPYKLCDDKLSNSHGQIGKEEWAFIPKDALPYLRYMADPKYDHIYTVDMMPYIIRTESKIILIGGMRLGGGCGEGLVSPPSDTDPVGRSAYFALDITDPLNPQYLWRYTHKNLGFSYSGPAHIVRKDSSGKNYHYVLFASGPTSHDGKTNQTLRIFTVDLFSGSEMDVYGENPGELKLTNSFGGRLFNEGLDVNKDGQTDFVFLGYTDNAHLSYKEMTGGVIKIYTGSENPSNWVYSKNFLPAPVSENPVVSPIMASDNSSKAAPYPYLFFGTGRYFTGNDQTQNVPGNVNYLYGIPFDYDENNNKITANTVSVIKNRDNLTCENLRNITTKPMEAAWKIPLMGSKGSFFRERCYSVPSVKNAGTTNINTTVFFTTSMPTNALCECGGRSRVWALNGITGHGSSWLPSDCTSSEQDDFINKYLETAFKYMAQLSMGNIKNISNDKINDKTIEAEEKEEGASDFLSGVASEAGGQLVDEFNLDSGYNLLYWKEW